MQMTTSLIHTVTGETCDAEQSEDNPDLCEHGHLAHVEYDAPCCLGATLGAPDHDPDCIG